MKTIFLEESWSDPYFPINANAANPYGKLPSASNLESLGVRVVQDGPLDSRFSGQTFLRTDGSVITNLDSMKTIVLEKIK